MLTGAEGWSESIRTYLQTQGVWSSHSGRVVDGQYPHISSTKDDFHDTITAQAGHHRGGVHHGPKSTSLVIRATGTGVRGFWVECLLPLNRIRGIDS